MLPQQAPMFGRQTIEGACQAFSAALLQTASQKASVRHGLVTTFAHFPESTKNMKITKVFMYLCPSYPSWILQT